MPNLELPADAVAVVTGGASGIGLAAALRFARMGLKVCIADLGEERLDRARAALVQAAPGGEGAVTWVRRLGRAKDGDELL